MNVEFGPYSRKVLSRDYKFFPLTTGGIAEKKLPTYTFSTDVFKKVQHLFTIEWKNKCAAFLNFYFTPIVF